MQDDKQLKKNSVFGGLSTKDLRKIPEELPLKKKEKNCGFKGLEKFFKDFKILSNFNQRQHQKKKS